MIKIYFKKVLALFTLMPFITLAQINLLQTTSNQITTAVLACANNNITQKNDFARLYDLTALGYSKFEVTKISFAVHGFQLGTASNFPVTVKVYASTGGTADTNLTLIQQVTVNIISSMAGTIAEVPLTTPAVVTSTAMLIVVSAPSGLATSTGFFPGGNSNGQTAPGYIKAADCGAPNFTSYNDVGGSNQHLILFPTGNPTASLSVANFNQNKAISFYPNPVKSTLNFSEEVSNIKITDLTGKTVKQTSVSTKSLDVSTLQNGIYIITGITLDGTTVNQKLIKE